MTKPKPKPSGAAHPVLAALIGQLPPIGKAFPADQRRAWLAMTAQAFDMVYGVTGVALELAPQPRVAAAAAPATPTSAKPEERSEHAKAGCDYYVDRDGYARCDVHFEPNEGGEPIPVPTPGRRVSAEEAHGHMIYEYRRGPRRDRETVVWADDATGSLPGMEFCGPG